MPDPPDPIAQQAPGPIQDLGVHRLASTWPLLMETRIGNATESDPGAIVPGVIDGLRSGQACAQALSVDFRPSPPHCQYRFDRVVLEGGLADGPRTELLIEDDFAELAMEVDTTMAA